MFIDNEAAPPPLLAVAAPVVALPPLKVTAEPTLAELLARWLIKAELVPCSKNANRLVMMTLMMTMTARRVK
jgi:hypothetical protein